MLVYDSMLQITRKPNREPDGLNTVLASWLTVIEYEYLCDSGQDKTPFNVIDILKWVAVTVSRMQTEIA